MSYSITNPDIKDLDQKYLRPKKTYKEAYNAKNKNVPDSIYAGLLIIYLPENYQIHQQSNSKFTPEVILVQTHRTFKETGSKSLEIPGGKCIKNEIPLYTAVREIGEELGLDLSNYDIEFVLSRILNEKTIYHFYALIIPDPEIFNLLHQKSVQNFCKKEIIDITKISLKICEGKNTDGLQNLTGFEGLLTHKKYRYEIDFLFVLYKLQILTVFDLITCFNKMDLNTIKFALRELEKLQRLISS
jgi:8-oxo-dGTP pyrophosphatase MutT (NUDIX family)